MDEEVSAATVPAIDVSVDALDSVSYALVANRLPALRAIKITNNSGSALSDVSIDVTIRAAGTNLVDKWHYDVGVEIAPNDSFILDTREIVDLDIDTEFLSNLTESIRGRFGVALNCRWHEEVRSTESFTLLAANEWYAAPELRETLISFVQPNTNTVISLLQDASSILNATTGSGALEGYQSGPRRAMEIGSAIYAAINKKGINYLELPASFEETGQRVRTPAEVMQTGFGNCVDLSLLYCSALEHAGLEPFIWLTNSHAMSGFYIEPMAVATRQPVLDDHSIARNLVDSERAVAVESTALATSDCRFVGAISAGKEKTTSHAFQALLDIRALRRIGIRPLPSPDDVAVQPTVDTGKSSNKTFTMSETLSLPDVTPPANEDANELARRQDNSPLRIQRWKKSLLDLSLRNPLLNLPRTSRVLRLHMPSGSLAELEDLVFQGKAFSILPDDDLTQFQHARGVQSVTELGPDELARDLTDEKVLYASVSSAAYRKRLKDFQRAARSMLQETGSNYLYLCLGSLVHPGSSRAAEAPLFILPIRVTGGVGNGPYKFDVDGDQLAVPNLCLVEWLKVKHHLAVPALENPPRDESGIDIDEALKQIRRGIADANLSYHVNDSASLAMLSFSTFQMWRDLEENWQLLSKNSVVRHLVESPGAEYLDPVVDSDMAASVPREEDLQLPIPADGSQIEAVGMAMLGQSFVLEGPPGTGKSQTITNMISALLASGKRVLFVAEKQAALEVVKKRLDKIGLGPFALDIHGRDQSINAVRSQIKDAMEIPATRDASTIQRLGRDLSSSIGELKTYPEAIHSANASGQSLWSAYEQSLILRDGPAFKLPTTVLNLSVDAQRDVERALTEFATNASRAIHTGGDTARGLTSCAWSLSTVADFEKLDANVLRDRLDAIERSMAAFSSLPEPLRVFASQRKPDGLVEDAEILSKLARTKSLRREALSLAANPRVVSDIRSLLQQQGRFLMQHRELFTLVRPEILRAKTLRGWLEDAKAGEAKTFGRKKRRNILAQEVAGYAHPGRTIAPDTILEFLSKLNVAQNDALLLFQRSKKVGIDSILPGWLPESEQAYEGLSQQLESLVSALELRREYAEHWTLLETPAGSDNPLAHIAPEIHDFTETFRDTAAAWSSFRQTLGVTNESLERWIRGSTGRTWAEAWQGSSTTWRSDNEFFRGLAAWTRVAAALGTIESYELGELAHQLVDGGIEFRDVTSAYDRGFYQAAINERRTAAGLDWFDGRVRDQKTDRYLNASTDIQDELPTALPTLVSRHRGFTSVPPRSPQATLKKELDRKRGGLSIRQLFDRYSEVILGLTPCVLMSPASVANFVAPRDEPIFDVTIFDEASQVRVSQAVGSIGRARSCIIVGDSKQMPPSSIMQASGRSVEESDLNVDPTSESAMVPEDMESILSEAVESQLPQQWLSWHYRSQHEGLIAFSNNAYYENHLATIPSPATVDESVEFRRINGTFGRGKDRTNPAEAEAIVDEVERRIHSPESSSDSIGVVTFNTQQRDRILDLLENHADPVIRQMMAEESTAIFVKNLENVQGDERDVILFSVAFSKDPATGKVPLQFGPLNTDGGERRLNVAITRAKKQVVIFCSFDPENLELGSSRSQGLNDLKRYLVAARDHAYRPVSSNVTQTRNAQGVANEIACHLRERGFDTELAYGLSRFKVDVVVREANSSEEPIPWRTAVILDGHGWARQPTVADREGSPELLLSPMNWGAVKRVWLPEWIANKDAVVEDIASRVDAAVESAAQEARDRTERERQKADLLEGRRREAEVLDVLDQINNSTVDNDQDKGVAEEVTSADEPEEVEGATGAEQRVTEHSLQTDRDAGGVREVAETPKHHDNLRTPFISAAERYQTLVGEKEELDQLRRNRLVRSKMQDVLRELVEFEGPIEVERLLLLAHRRFGMMKVVGTRREVARGLIDPSAFYSEDGHKFAWPSRLDPNEWFGYRFVTSSTDRTIHEVAPEEIANAMRSALMNGSAMSSEELMREAYTSLGYKRMGGHARETLLTALRLGVSTDRFVVVEGKYRL